MRMRDAVRMGLAVMAMFAAVFAAAQTPAAPLKFRAPLCALAYRGASAAIDSVYGIVPGVDPSKQLHDSLVLSDAAEQVRLDPDSSGPLCTVEKVDQLKKLTASLTASQGRLAADDKAAKVTRLADQATKAVQDVGTWLSPR